MMKIRYLAAVSLSGILLSLAWLGFSGLVLLIAFVPLLWVEYDLLQKRHYNLPVVFWSYSLITFIIWNALTTWWIWNATPGGAIFAIVLNSLFMSLVWWFTHVASRKQGPGFGHILLIFAWITFEFLHYHWELAWPWLTLGNGMANDVYLIQWYEYTGVFGGSAWILLANLMIWNWFRITWIENKDVHLFQKLSVMGLLLLPIGLSVSIYYQYEEKPDPVHVVIAQPNIDPYRDKFTHMPYREQYGRLLHLSDSLGTDDVDFFLGPETALHEVWLNNWKYSLPIRTVQNFLSEKYPNSAFIVGGMSYYEYLFEEERTTTVRYNRDSTFFYDAFNSAYLITRHGPEGIYHKSKLVAGVEQMAYERYLRFLDKLVIDLGGTTGSLATLGKPEVFEHHGIKVGVPICYESAFGSYVAGFVNEGAEVLMVITNDGWWKNTPGYRQHLAYSRMLAIEFRRSIARSGNTGISAFINQRGEIVQQTAWWTATAMRGTINRNDRLTFYARQGDYLARMSVFMFGLMLLTLLVSFLRREK
jgi:apolipoprotein N-acyltransferase